MSEQRQPASARGERGMVVVTWVGAGAGAEEESEFPCVWLRDSCPCAECWHPSQARILRMSELCVDVMPESVQVTDGRVCVSWSDGHRSEYPGDWLLAREFTPRAIERRVSADVIKPTPWGPELQGHIPRVTYQELLEDDAARLRWHEGLETQGIYLVTGAPPGDDRALHRLASKVAFLRTTNYGPEFTVQSKVDPSSLAYTAETLGFHTDLSNYNYVPGVQMLHCVLQTQAQGGENNFADGFHVAAAMSGECPDHFAALSQLPIDWADIGRESYDYHIRSRKPIIGLNKSGEVCQIDYSNHLRDNALNIPLDRVIPLFRAMKEWDDKLQPGEIVCFDNQRVLHGRIGYQLEAGGERKLIGGYIDWDEMRSARRVLQYRLGKR